MKRFWALKVKTLGAFLPCVIVSRENNWALFTPVVSITAQTPRRIRLPLI